MVFVFNYSPFTTHYLTRHLPARLAISSAATTEAATTAATTAATSAVAAKSAASAAAPTIAAILSWSGLVNGQVAAVEVCTIELLNCFFAVFFRSHLDESKTS
jgi:hypothetical protein